MATYKEINHDSSTTIGDFYDSVTDPDGSISVLVAAALGGSTNGVRMDYDAGNNLTFMRETIASFTTETTLSWRVRVNFANLSNSAGIVNIFLFMLDDISTSNDPFKFTAQFNGTSTIEVRVSYFSDSGGNQNFDLVSVPTSGDVCLLIQATKETADGNADGEVEWFLNGVSQDSVSNVDNFNNFGIFDRCHIGFASQNSTISGTMDYDEFLLDDAITALCGTPAFSGYDLVLGGGQP